MKRAYGSICALFLLASLQVFPARAEDFKLSGYMFGDYYWIAQNHDPSLTDNNGFWFRRIYMTFDKALSEEFSIRLRFEMNSPGDFESSSKLVPFVKDGYLKWKHERHQIVLGLSPTPTWDVIEKIWGYRSVEKTPLDLQKFGSSRDIGIAFKGSLDGQKRVRYHAMFANGSGTKAETNKGKRGLASLGFYPNEWLVVEFYGDITDQPLDTSKYKARYTLQGFVGAKQDRGRVGVMYARQVQRMKGSEDLELDLVSAFAVVKVAEKVDFLARYDGMLDPNPAGGDISYIPFDPEHESHFVLVGLDCRPHESVHLIPNIEYVRYGEAADENSEDVDDDVIARVTYYYKF